MKILTDTEYFAFPAVSKSQLHKYDPYNPMGFWNICKLNPKCAPDEITDAMINGKLRHTLLLEPAKFEAEFKVIKGGRGYGSRSNVAFKDLMAENPGVTIVTEKEVTLAKTAIDTLKSYPLIQDFLYGLTIEKAYLWKDKATGLPLKCKLDGIKKITDGLIIGEYKTASNLDTILRGVDIPGWQWDIGMQTKAVKEKYGVEPFKMVFVIQSNEEGEEHKIAFRSLDSADCNTCEMFVDLALEKIAERYEAWQGGDADAWKTRLIEEGFLGANGGSFSYNFDRYFEALRA